MIYLMRNILIMWTNVQTRIEQFRVYRRSMCCEAVFGGSVRKRCVTLDLIVYLIRTLCSSGENIPVLGALVESLSRGMLEMSFRMRRASSIERSAKAEAYSLLPMGEPSTTFPLVEM